ncbi:S1C family serine protease [Aquabacter cavernae]|uniref:S1C family serine protease n=1 Tax=Aquabacter cavernae TaxID=2496029 RepID=UPI0013DEC939|nr:serine protease [Aquabacter cavernae]
MKSVRFFALVLAAWSLIAAETALARQVKSFDVRGWDVHVYVDDDTGAFSNCVASAEYESGMVLAFQIGADFSWNMAVFDAPVTFKKGQKVDVRYQVDGGRTRRASATAEDTDFLLIPLPDDVDLFSEFRQGKLLRVFVSGRTAGFRLDGTAAMLAALLDCADKHQNMTADSGGGKRGKGEAEAGKTDKGKDGGKGSGKGGGDASEGDLSTGSGFFVTSDGVALTNAHVIEGCTEAVIAGYGAARILATDTANDLALLKVTTPAATTPARFRRKHLQLGETIFVMGFPLAGQLDNGLNFTSGIVSSLAGPGNDTRSLQLTAPIQAGNSGGPIVDSAGLLVGVTQAKLSEVAAIKSGGAFPQNVNFGIKSDLAASFLRANSVDAQEVETAEGQPAVAIARDGRAYTIQVKCTPK